jgi:hypothetical protein
LSKGEAAGSGPTTISVDVRTLRVLTAVTVVFEGGTHHESMRMRVRDLIRIADAQVADITLGSSCNHVSGHDQD